MPFRQGPDSRSALIAGTIHFYVYPLPAIMTLLKAGTLKALAVASPKRAEALPRGIVTRINTDTVGVLKEQATREKFMLQGANTGFGSPEHFDKMQRDEYAELRALIKESGMQVQ